MKKSGFFNSAENTTDRAYQAIDFALPFGALAGGKGGIVMGVGDAFKVDWVSGGTFTLGSGFAFLGEMPGWWYYADEETVITLSDAATPSNPCFALSDISGQKRTNILAIKMDGEINRASELVVLSGDENEAEDAYLSPSIDNSDGYDVYYVPIAEVKTNTEKITEVKDIREAMVGGGSLPVPYKLNEAETEQVPYVRAGYCGIQQLKDENTDEDVENTIDIFRGEWKESYYGIGISDGTRIVTQGFCNIDLRYLKEHYLKGAIAEGMEEAPEDIDTIELASPLTAAEIWPVTYYVQEDGRIDTVPTQKIAGFSLSESLFLVSIQGPYGQNDKYEGQMINFTAIPGISGKVRFKIHLPEDAKGVKLKYKPEPWAVGNTMAEDGIEIADLTSDANLYGDNFWYEVTIPADETENPETVEDGTLIYVKAFPYASSPNEEHITEDEEHDRDPNEVTVTVGTLLHEWTADGDASANSTTSNYGLTLNEIQTDDALIDQGFLNSASATEAYARIANEIDMGGKTISFWVKHTGTNTGLFGYTGLNHLAGQINEGIIEIGAKYNTGETIVTEFTIDTTQYHHIAVTVDNHNVELYVDGGLADGVTVNSNISNNINVLGRGSIATAQYLNASMDQIRIFNCKLNIKDIKNLYNGGLGC